MKKFIFYLLLITMASCGKDAPCTDDTNPTCPNYNPCKDKVKTTADFYIYDILNFPSIDGWEYVDTDSVGIGAIFTAKMPQTPYVTYEWHIGGGVYNTQVVKIPDGMPLDSKLSATLIVRNSKINKNCFPDEDSIKTFTRNFYPTSNRNRMLGIYRGAFDDFPNDSVDFAIYDSTGIGRETFTFPFQNCVSTYNIFLGNNGTMAIAVNPIDSLCQNKLFEYNSKYGNACIFTLSKDSKTFKIKMIKNLSQTKDYIMHGRKLR